MTDLYQFKRDISLIIHSGHGSTYAANIHRWAVLNLPAPTEAPPWILELHQQQRTAMGLDPALVANVTIIVRTTDFADFPTPSTSDRITITQPLPHPVADSTGEPAEQE
jgi:hypothetical protein